jgi:hypothetical protein
VVLDVRLDDGRLAGFQILLPEHLPYLLPGVPVGRTRGDTLLGRFGGRPGVQYYEQPLVVPQLPQT